MSDDRKRFTGLDALSEIGRRLEDLSKVVQTKLNKAPGEPQTFTIDTARGPMTGVFGFEVRNLADGPPAGRPAARAHRPAQAPSKPATAQEAGPLVDIFDEGATLVVMLDLPVSDPAHVAASVEGQTLRLVDPIAQQDIATVALPRAPANPAISVQITNGIVEVRIRDN